MSDGLNATHYENIPTYPCGVKPRDRRVHAVIETVQGSAHKNALDSEFGIIKLKAVLPEGFRWPYDYGFIPRTLAAFPGALAEARVLGSVKLKKNGIENDRIIAAPTKMPGVVQSADAYTELEDIPKDHLDALCAFLIDYSRNEGNQIELIGLAGADAAMKSVKRYARSFKKKAKD